MKYLITLIFFTTLLMLNSCGEAGTASDCIGGSGRITRDTVKTENYKSVYVENRGNVFFEKASEIQTIIKTDDNIHPVLNVFVNSLTLNIIPQDFICPTELDIFLKMPFIERIFLRGAGNIQNLESFENPSVETIIEGSGNITLSDIKTQIFKSKISGSGNIFAVGTADLASAEIIGSGNINLEYFTVKELVCTIEGSGNVRVNASESLTVRIYGNGNVYYKGSPEKFDVEISGNGKIIHLD